MSRLQTDELVNTPTKFNPHAVYSSSSRVLRSVRTKGGTDQVTEIACRLLRRCSTLPYGIHSR